MDNIGFIGEVELGVICVTFKVNVVPAKDLANGKEVNDKEEGPQERPLRHTVGYGGWFGNKKLKLDKLSAARKI